MFSRFLILICAIFGGAAAQAAMPRLIVQGNDATSAVQLQIQSAEWMINGPFAEQQFVVEIHNPGSRNLEVTLALQLETDQRLRSYALDINGELRQAVPVEREKARATFEEVTYRQVDPSVVEKEAGNRYKIRVFPVPAQGKRTVAITIASLANHSTCGWQHQFTPFLDSSEKATLRITSPQKIASNAVKWTSANQQYVAKIPLTKTTHQKLCVPADASTHFTAQTGPFSMQWVDLKVPAQSIPSAPIKTLEIVWDHSSSMQFDRFAAYQLLDQFFAGRSVQVILTRVNHTFDRQVFEIRNGDWTELKKVLLATIADGASAIRQWQPDASADAAWVFSDLIDTWSPVSQKWSQPTIPVSVITEQHIDLPSARWLSRHNGQVVAATDPTALKQLSQQFSIRVNSDPFALDTSWYAESMVPQNGRLRACRISDSSAQASHLPLLKTTTNTVEPQKLPAASHNDLIAFWCASWWVDALESDPLNHKGLLAVIGDTFHVVNANTSLLVLEAPADYARFKITPPASEPKLVQQVAALTPQVNQTQAQSNRGVAAKWQARQAWWNRTSFAKKPQAAPSQPVLASPPASPPAAEYSNRPPAPMVAREEPAPANRAALSVAHTADIGTTGRQESSTAQSTAPTVRFNAVPIDAPYVHELASYTTADSVYQQFYQVQLPKYRTTPAFYVDVADKLWALGDANRAVQVLSNVVELMPNDLSVLRALAYRLQQAGQLEAALVLLERVKTLASDQAQTWRDLGLVYARLQRCDVAQQHFIHAATTAFRQISGDIDEISLAEANDLSERCPSAIFDALDPALKASLPVGLRVVLRWDQNASDIDMHIIDPNGEKVSYQNRLSGQGGRISTDVTDGFGPEEFILRNPVPGEYKVYVNYYGSRLSTITRGTTVQIDVQTNFAADAKTAPSASVEKERHTTTLRLLDPKRELVLVATILLDQNGKVTLRSE